MQVTGDAAGVAPVVVLDQAGSSVSVAADIDATVLRLAGEPIDERRWLAEKPSEAVAEELGAQQEQLQAPDGEPIGRGMGIERAFINLGPTPGCSTESVSPAMNCRPTADIRQAARARKVPDRPPRKIAVRTRRSRPVVRPRTRWRRG